MAPPVTRLPVKNPAKAPSAAPSAHSPVEMLRRRIDRLFHELDFDYARWPPADFGAPAVDLVEHERDYVIEAELPGMELPDIALSVSNGVLLLQGAKHAARVDRHCNHYVAERRYGVFRRSFPLPAGADADHIEASFSHGVLKIRLPKNAEALRPPRKIAIKVV